MAAFAEYRGFFSFNSRTFLQNSQEHRVLRKEETRLVMEVPIGDRWERCSETKQIGIPLTLGTHAHFPLQWSQ